MTDTAVPASADLSALDLLATLVAVVDDAGRIVYANHALEDAIGLSRRNLQGVDLADWLLPASLWHNALQGAQQHEYAVIRYDTQLRRLLRPPLPVHLVLATTDERARRIVEMLPLEQQARQEREERLLEQTQANKAMIRNLAHEIKNPLGGIRGAAQLLQMELGQRPDLAEYTDVIVHEADRLQALVDRLLEPHRRALQFSDVNIHEVCERVRAVLLAEFPKGLQVVRDYDTSIPEFRGDRELLIQAVLNLAHNAAQALRERIAAGDARITLRTRVQRQVTFGKRRVRLALELHVIDNGPGVPDDIRERIFYPLVSGRDGGTGLGLTLAQTFVQQHQGLIECDSRPGHTDFTILIPLA
ncbi:MAG: nitrogen regulation protein NR(II) [Tepidimonas ignava]|uniref:Sensory histidine kinase/phosphatase NtrB n=1 Tax=Tepidimonas ignava TaxID=114249 RepID=A0A4R3L651_9BURK|nr:nitrogen regulation protein NR(II) [Tepidimonas ignava]TCS95183.1 nitrogen specific signal transduction histidine kinase NtrB [Tepidimonas ignava]TSE19330.1 Nitrogen regulation protein NR(II) [Tepidimonas ignava]